MTESFLSENGPLTIKIFGATNQVELDLCDMAPGMFSALHTYIHVFLRDKLKYGHEYQTPDEALEACRTELFELLDDQGVNLDRIP